MSPSREADSSPVARVRPALQWSLVLAAGVLAGIASWLGGEASKSVIKPRLQEGTSKGRLIRVASRHDQGVADAKNAGVAFALLGGLLSAGLGVAGGLARRSGRAAATAGLVGFILGTAAGAGTSAAVLPFYHAYQERHPDEASRALIFPLLVHVGISSAVGGAGGLAFGLGLGLGARGRLPRCLLGAVAGAVAGTLAYDLIGAAVFPLATTAQIVSETWQGRLLARLTVAVLAAAGAAAGATEPLERPVSANS